MESGFAQDNYTWSANLTASAMYSQGQKYPSVRQACFVARPCTRVLCECAVCIASIEE